ncbi:putative transmembrane prolyl 4-hydroxylase [Apostichopus japonicus]|uniref:Putative transmembrane prolyl 4-hydroxylase n=1 Tax=Stichopus japonicus TaxID=307972 RepID=A0A2G8KAZ5_STIJA|nr:putative transmembrane prolyl 4-hydroxylase [Apostichopus japonicus]
MEYNGIAHCSIKRCIIIVGCVTFFLFVNINITTANENIDGTIENENIITEGGGGGGGGIVIENMERGDEIGNIAVDDSIQEELKDIENAGIRESDVRVESESIVTDEDVNSGTNDVSEEIPPVIIPEDMQLTQLDPVEVGYVRQMELEPGKFYDVKTIGSKPPIFDKNELLDLSETRKALAPLDGLNLMFDDTFRHFVDIVLDLDSDRLLSALEFRRIPLIMSKVTDWIEKHHDVDSLGDDVKSRMKSGPDRISHQVWINHNEYDAQEVLRNRLIKLTGLHPDIIKTSEQLQVVHYTPGGHYHAHHDSTQIIDGRPCAHTSYLYPHDPHSHLLSSRVCRYITVLYYLADTEEGGETAFPAADNETFSEQSYVKDNKTVEPRDLTSHCKDANLYLQPHHRMAVMWYNHHLDRERGWLGDRNLFAFHGGCDVIKGEKWIANNWITVDDNYEMQMLLHYKRIHEPQQVVLNIPPADVTEVTKDPTSNEGTLTRNDDVIEGINQSDDESSQGHHEL